MKSDKTENAKAVCDDWNLAQEIGRGAYGVVYLAQNAAGECVALKVCRREEIGEESYSRELRGVKLYRQIPPQDGLVRMRDLVETEWGFYSVFDLADDEFDRVSNSSNGYRPKTLSHVIAGEKALPLKESLKLALSLTKGLVVLQKHHLLHRDIKPSNVVYVGGLPVLSDPGLLIEAENAVSLVGTPGYVPPEKFTDAASDIYSIGLTLKAASFGRPVNELDKGPAMEADTSSPSFPAWWRILNRATDATPARRYQSAKALLKDLELLRLRMTMSKLRWLVRTAMSVTLLAVVAYAYVVNRERMNLAEELAPLKKAIAVMDSMNEMSTKDDTTWSSFAGSYFCHVDESHRQRLRRAEEKNPVRAAQMRAILNDMVEIDKKGEANNQRIKALREKKDGAKDPKQGAEDYNQAELLSLENEKLVKAWLSLLERFTLLEDVVKQNK